MNIDATKAGNFKQPGREDSTIGNNDSQIRTELLQFLWEVSAADPTGLEDGEFERSCVECNRRGLELPPSTCRTVGLGNYGQDLTEIRPDEERIQTGDRERWAAEENHPQWAVKGLSGKDLSRIQCHGPAAS